MKEGRIVRVPLSPEERRKKLALWLPLWCCAAFLLFGNLGVNPIVGSEARWLIVAREMLSSGDWFHPTINAEPYFDKPLLTYWLIALPSLLNGSTVTEFTGRLYSVFAALAALGGLILIARHFLDERASAICGWLFITLYSFGAFGRLAEADMANLAFCTLAVAWYLRYAEKKSLSGYILFFVICGAGAHAKGMAAFAIPCLAVLADLIISKRCFFHLNWKFFIGVFIGIAVYALPFILSSVITPAVAASTQNTVSTDGTLLTSGIALALRENVVRFFAPFDHNHEAFYSYLIHLPRHLVPWTPFFLLALIHAWCVRKELSNGLRWLLLTIGFIFLFFTLSGSRRHYYILPILPFCMILTGWYLYETASGWNERIKKILLWCYAWLPVIALGLFALSLLVIRCFPTLVPAGYLFVFSPLIRQTLFVSAVLFFAILLFQWQLGSIGSYTGNATLPLKSARAFFSTAAAMIFLFVYLIPVFSMTRTEKRTEIAVGKFIRAHHLSTGQFFFYHELNQRAFYYLDLKQKVPVLDSPEEVKAQQKKLDGKPLFLLAQKRYLDHLSGLRTVMTEQALPWEKGKLLTKKLELRMTPFQYKPGKK